MKIVTTLIRFNRWLENGTNQSGHITCSPRSGADTAEVNTGPIVVVYVVDRSSSMSMEDYPPSRFEAAINAIAVHLEVLSQASYNAYAAVICFDDYSEIALPLTHIKKYKQIEKALRSLAPKWGGTDIAKGLQEATDVLERCSIQNPSRTVLLLTDGHGGDPIAESNTLKQQHNATIDVVGIGGTRQDVNESLLKQVATTDPDGHNHYRFIKDAHSLKLHYRELATSLVWKGNS